MNHIIKYYLKVKYNININKTSHTFKINKTISIALNFFKVLINILFNRIYYVALILIGLKDTDLSIKLFVLFNLIGSIDNTYIFKLNNIKSILFKNLRIKPNSYKYIYYYELIIDQLINLIFNYIYLNIIKIENLNIILLFIFTINIKIISNSIFLFLYKRYNYLYNEDEPNKYIYLIHIILLLLFEFYNIFIIYIISIVGILSHIYIIKYDFNNLIKDIINIKYDEIETIKIIKNKIKDYKSSNKYLNHIFNKRHMKYLISYFIKSIIVILLLIYLNNKDLNKIPTIIGILYLGNINIKMFELYYYKCDKYLKNNLNKKIHLNRFNTMLIIDLLITFILDIFIFIRYKSITIILISIIITLVILVINYLIYILFNPYKNNKRKITYIITNYLISIIFFNIT